MKKIKSENIRKALSIVLCLAFIISYIPVLSFNAGATDIIITEGETLTVNGVDSVTLKFIPESDAEYALESNSDTDPYVTLYDSQMNHISGADDANGRDFCLTHSLAAGQVYYFVLYDYHTTNINYSVTLTKTHDHQGGEATCKGKACDICGEYYGAGDPTKHQGGTATCLGKLCEFCDKYYGEADENGHDLSGYATCQGEYCYICDSYIKGEVDSDNHLWEDSSCVCGAVCEDHIWEDGYCNICEAEHEHEEYGDDGKCVVCGYQYYNLVVIDGNQKSYYTDISDAVDNAPEGSTIKLLAECYTWARNVYFEKSVTLDLNGQVIDCVSSENLVFNANVTINDSVGTGVCRYIDLEFNALCTINGGYFNSYLGFNAEGTTAEDYLGGNKKFYSVDEVCSTEPIDASQATSLRNVRVASSGGCSSSYENGFCVYCGSFETPELNSENYHEIDNVGKLFWFSEKVNSGETSINAILTRDIVVNPGKISENGAFTEVGEEKVYHWIPIGETYDTRYTGVFDGNNKTVSGLYYNDDTVDYVGMFGCIGSDANVKNIRIENSFFYGKNYVGAVVGLCYGKVTGSSSDAYVKATLYAGGIVGYLTQSKASIENCYNTGSVEAISYYAGGIAGHNQAKIYNCYNAGSVTAQNYAGEITSENYEPMGATTENCFYLATEETDVLEGTTFKTAEQFASGEVAYRLQSANEEQRWGQESNQPGSLPVLDTTGIYKVVTIGKTGVYSIANIGDTNGDGNVDEKDYINLVNAIFSGTHSQSGKSGYNDIIKYDIDGDGYLDALDAHLLNLLIKDLAINNVYAVGDFNLNGVAFEDEDLSAVKHAVENPAKLSTVEKYACDINGDGKVSEADLTEFTAAYGNIYSETHIFSGKKCKICGYNKLNISDVAKTVYFNDNDNKLNLSTLFTLPDGAGNVTYEFVSGSGNLEGSTLNIVLQGTEKIKVTVAETETCSADEFEITVTVEAPKGSGGFIGPWVPIG